MALCVALLAACASGGAGSSADSGPVPPGSYRVERGDTLYRIASKHGQRVSNLVRWNNLANANQLEVGQVLRVAPPSAGVAAPAPATTNAVTVPPDSESKPLAPGGAVQSYNPDAELGKGFALKWPAAGPVLQSYSGKSSRGIDIGGSWGDPVTAAHAGKVIHVGPLRGYGNLIIIKYNDQYLSAYAHNDKIIVREGDTVKQGQQIAEMGKSDADQVKLHFEFRRKGQPIDPARYLPSR